MKYLQQLITLGLFSNLLLSFNIYAEESKVDQCNIAVNQQDADTALTIAHTLLQQNKQNVEAQICQARALSLTGDLAKAVSAFNAAKDLTQDPFQQVLIHILLGNAYKTALQPTNAVSAYEKSAVIAKTHKNANYERISYNLIGDTHFANKKYPLALDYYLKANTLTANDNERGESYENIALTHYHLDAMDEALAYQIKAFFMHEKVGSLDQFANSSITLGDYYRLNKNYQAAENTLNKIIAFCKAQGGSYFEAKASYTLAKVKIDTGDKSSATTLTQHAKKIATDTQDQALMQEIEQSMQ